MRREAYESLPDILNAGMLAEALGISRAGAYQLLNSADFPTLPKMFLLQSFRLI